MRYSGVLHSLFNPAFFPPRSQTAATIADLFFTASSLDLAKEAVQVAVAAAEASKLFALMIKLSNNLAAVHRNKGE